MSVFTPPFVPPLPIPELKAASPVKTVVIKKETANSPIRKKVDARRQPGKIGAMHGPRLPGTPRAPRPLTKERRMELMAKAIEVTRARQASTAPMGEDEKDVDVP